MLMKNSKGFTLIEILVSIAIIAILAVIIVAQLQRVGAKARDAERIETAEEIAAAVELWYQEYGRDPYCRGGIKIENVDIESMSVAEINTQLVFGGGMTVSSPSPTTIANDTCDEAKEFYAFLRGVLGGSMPTDPLGPGNNDYYYYYDAGHNCDFIGSDPAVMDGATMVYAVNLETRDSNVLEVCAAPSGNDGGYLNTEEFGGIINPSQPYIKILKRQING